MARVGSREEGGREGGDIYRFLWDMYLGRRRSVLRRGLGCRLPIL